MSLAELISLRDVAQRVCGQDISFGCSTIGIAWIRIGGVTEEVTLEQLQAKLAELATPKNVTVILPSTLAIAIAATYFRSKAGKAVQESIVDALKKANIPHGQPKS